MVGSCGREDSRGGTPVLLPWATTDKLCDLKKTHNFSGPSSPIMSSQGVVVDLCFLPRDAVCLLQENHTCSGALGSL